MSDYLPNGEEIRRLRKEKYGSQREFEIKTNGQLSQSWLGQMERVEGKGRAKEMKMLAGLLGVPLEQIVIPKDQEQAYLEKRKREVLAVLTGDKIDNVINTWTREEQIALLHKLIVRLLGREPPLLDALDGSVKLIYILTFEELAIVQDAIERGELKGGGVEFVDARTLSESDLDYKSLTRDIADNDLIPMSELSIPTSELDIPRSESLIMRIMTSEWKWPYIVWPLAAVLFILLMIRVEINTSDLRQRNHALALQRDVFEAWIRVRIIADTLPNNMQKKEIVAVLEGVSRDCLLDRPQGNNNIDSLGGLDPGQIEILRRDLTALKDVLKSLQR